MKFGRIEGISRSVERIRIGLVNKSRAARHPNVLKPASLGKRFPNAPRELSGVKGDGVCRRVGWEHERAVVAAGRAVAGQSVAGNHNRGGCRERQSERLVVAMKRLIPVERRGLGVSGADSKVRVG